MAPARPAGAVLDEVAYLVATHPETRGRDVLLLRYRADVWACEVAQAH